LVAEGVYIMPPNISSISGRADFIRQIGELSAVMLFSFVLIFAVLPQSLWLVPYRTGVIIFTGLILMTTLLPPAVKLFADTFEKYSFLSSFLGEFPFHHWTLYYHPLLDREVKSNFLGGLNYPTIVFDEGDTSTERLLLDSMIEPMNISGLVLHFIPTLLSTDDNRVRQDLVKFFVDFLWFKIEYYQEHGDYSVSRRYLGRYSFPTANTHIEPPHNISRKDIQEIRIYYVPWPEDLERLNVPSIVSGGLTDDRAMMVASYTITPSGSVSEAQFSPTDDT
jgi:hypothetical protein